MLLWILCGNTAHTLFLAVVYLLHLLYRYYFSLAVLILINNRHVSVSMHAVNHSRCMATLGCGLFASGTAAFLFFWLWVIRLELSVRLTHEASPSYFGLFSSPSFSFGVAELPRFRGWLSDAFFPSANRLGRGILRHPCPPTPPSPMMPADSSSIRCLSLSPAFLYSAHSWRAWTWRWSDCVSCGRRCRPQASLCCDTGATRHTTPHILSHKN